MTIHFSCTMCGRCCHGLRLPIGVDEAMAWLRDGGNVQLFCEAIPWPEEPPADNHLAWYKRRRSFAATSGQLPVRVIVSLMAVFEGACPNLQPDMRCGIYERRPRACRVYPAEVNPFFALDRDTKLCPPEAWQTQDVLQGEDGEWKDAEVAQSIAGMREADARDAAVKAELCAVLGISSSGLSNEGVVVHAPDRARLLSALEEATTAGGDVAMTAWHVVSHRRATLELLQSAGTSPLPASALQGTEASFMGFVAGDAD
ncbi:YkgJ family cysteine cluster protein [Luteibacter sp.]|jgi:Fe-S-cluster containining protein|uniref:YkgJ family cysteine cluster protein n=1 Tax=Luteibacter sp. TaxID=1886636 RepID=UPI002F3ED217